MDMVFLDLDDLLSNIAEGLSTDYGFDGCAFAFWNEAEGSLVNHYARLPPRLREMEAAYRHFRFQANEGTIAGLAFARKSPLILDVQSVEAHSQTVKDMFHRWGFGTFAAWPIVLHTPDGGTQQLGVFSGFFEDGRMAQGVAEEVTRKLSAIAPSIEAVLDQDQCEVMDPDLADQHQLIRAMTRSGLGDSTNARAEPVCRYLMQRFGFDMAALVLRDGKELKLNASWFAPSHSHLADSWKSFDGLSYRQEVTDGVTAVVFTQNNAFMVGDVQSMADDLFPAKDRECLAALRPVRSYLILPVRAGDGPIGVLWLLSLSQPVSLGESSLATLQLLADFMGSQLPQ